ncbi:MAG: cupin [Minisyncoccia bacterium]|jgi:mannose-6-phosphate isomerase-like protein (cupin superfamily)
MKIGLKKALRKHKHGVDIWVYKTGRKDIGFVYEKTTKGHLEEFYHKKSTYLYYVLKGKGKFYLNGKGFAVRVNDIVVAPPRTKIYFLGKMELLLITVPAWQSKHEVHVRNIKPR